MYANFYILLSIFTLIVILVIILNYSKPNIEKFLTNTIELTNLTLEPLSFNWNEQIAGEFLLALAQYIPLKKSVKNPEFIVEQKSLAIYDYFQNNNENIRLVTNLYEIFLSVLR